MYYQHRISHCHEWSYPLLDECGLLSVGWSHFASRQFVNGHQQPGGFNENPFDRVPEAVDEEWQGWGKRAHSLGRFLQMNQGDRVVVPIWGRQFHVYVIVDGVRLVPEDIEEDLIGLQGPNGAEASVVNGRLESDGNEIELGFFRRVQPIGRVRPVTNVPRGQYANNALQSRMKALQTTLEIDDLAESVDEAVNRYQENRPINIRFLIQRECAQRVLDVIRHNMSDQRFEELIRLWFERQGAVADVQPKNSGFSGDVDVIARFESLRVSIYVQAKRHHGGTETDGWAVEQIEQYRQDRDENGEDGYTRIYWVISTADGFTTDCVNSAREHGVRLVDGIQFTEMLLDAGIEWLP